MTTVTSHLTAELCSVLSALKYPNAFRSTEVMQISIFIFPWEELLTGIDFLTTHSELHKYY